VKMKPLTSETDRASDRDYLMRRVSEMEREFSSFRDHYKELSEFIEPRRGRFFIDDRNRGDRRFKNIINNHGTLALRRAAAGMLAGVMSPSRPWFSLDTMDVASARDKEAQIWLDMLKRLTLMVLSKSNCYNMAPTMLRELLLFGVGCMTHVDDYEDVARFYTHTVGSYMISANSRQEVDTLARKVQMTAYQMVQKFGLENVSQAVRTNFDRSNYGAWHTVYHFIELNPFRDEQYAKLSSEALPFRSVYWEANTKAAADKSLFLSRKGFKGFPAYVPRWEVTGEDIYATNCPGMTNLGDVKQLQLQEREKAKAIAKAGSPPLQGPPSLRNRPISNLPGGITLNTGTNGKIETMYNVDPRIQEMLFDIDATKRRISEGFFVDLFMAITDMAGVQPKNQLQLSQVNEERLLQIGPVLEQIHGEWLSRMVSRVIQQVLEADLMPPPPKSLQGKELNIEFVSALAMAQRSVATGAIERTVFFAGQLSQSGWDMRHKVDADYALDEYSALVGAPPQLIKPTEEAQQQRQQEAQQMAQQQMLEQGAQAANIAKMASDAKLDNDNVLSRATENAQQ